MRKEIVTTELEVRWGECDPAGIVYHPSFIDWFSVARMHYLSENDIPYMKEFHARGVAIVVLGVECKYLKALVAEEKIRVDARLEELNRTRAAFAYTVFKDTGEISARGRTEHAFVDLDKRPLNLAKHAPELWERLQSLLS